jgi:hypothetical protein
MMNINRFGRNKPDLLTMPWPPAGVAFAPEYTPAGGAAVPEYGILLLVEGATSKLIVPPQNWQSLHPSKTWHV